MHSEVGSPQTWIAWPASHGGVIGTPKEYVCEIADLLGNAEAKTGIWAEL
jgi:hypothetical protein